MPDRTKEGVDGVRLSARRAMIPHARVDTGSVLLFLLIAVTLGFLIFTGIVADAGRAQHANARASDLAAKAARVGAQELDLAALRSGTDRLDPVAARTAATR